MKIIIIDNNSRNGLFSIETVGGRKLTGRPIFQGDEYICIAFQVDRFQRVPVESIKNAKEICDYYYSPSSDQKAGYCTADGEKYTECVSTGRQPWSRNSDLRFVKTASGCNIKSFNNTGQLKDDRQDSGQIEREINLLENHILRSLKSSR